MRKSNGDKRPYLRPVTRIELSEKNIKPRLILLVVCLAIAAAALFTGVRELLKVEPGWQEIQISSKKPNCSSEFVLMYDFSDYGGTAAAASRELTNVYTEAAEKAFLIFSPDVEDLAVQNLWQVNRHINEPVAVDPVLYEAFRQIRQAENRNLYLAPAYVEYNRIFLCENQEEAAGYDPAFNEELRAYLAELGTFASDPAHIDLELLGENRICLKVSQEYLAFIQEYELETLVDFGWMKNAFIADYLAQRLTEKGYTSGYLTSFDGFTRNLDPRGNAYSINFFHREGTQISMPGRIGYTGPMSIVSLRDFPLSDQDRWHYYTYGSGSIVHITSVFLDPKDGLSKASVDALMGYSRDAGCAGLLLELIPVFLAETFHTTPLDSLAEQGIYGVWYQDQQICSTDPNLSLEIP